MSWGIITCVTRCRGRYKRDWRVPSQHLHLSFQFLVSNYFPSNIGYRTGGSLSESTCDVSLSNFSFCVCGAPLARNKHSHTPPLPALPTPLQFCNVQQQNACAGALPGPHTRLSPKKASRRLPNGASA